MVKPGTYRGGANSYSVLNISRFINKIYKGSRIMAIGATGQMQEGVVYYNVDLVLKEAEFIGIYAEVNEALFEDFLNSVEWEGMKWLRIQ